MEQKTFLAIVLSFLFLMTYNAFVIAPQQKSTALINSQAIENKESANTHEVMRVDDSQAVEPNPISNSETEEAKIGGFKIKFTKDQGVIKEIYNEALQYSPILTNILTTSRTAKLKSYSVERDILLLNYSDGNVDIQKRIKPIDRNKVSIQIEYLNADDMSKLKNVHFEMFDINGHLVKSDRDALRDSMLLEYSIFADGKIIRKNNAYKFSTKEQKSEVKTIDWFGWRDRYHFTVIKPEFKTAAYKIHYYDEHLLGFEVVLDETNKMIEVPKTFNFTLYMGPQDLELLRNLDGNINKIMAFSGNSILDAIEKFIYKSLLFINNFTKNWGISIILISILLYAATYPLTLKSMLSMRKMQDLQPKMAELREKYKNDPQKLNTEVVQLYRIHNINPLGGCLPMLLQMPIFISLYQVLWRTHNFEGAQFLWIKDLSMPDKLFLFDREFPFIGNEFNILPIFMMFIMFLQQKLSAKNMVITDPSQEMQQKMMTFVFPVFIAGIFYHFASGLTLYFTVFYLLSTLTQYKMSKKNVAIEYKKPLKRI